MSAIDDLQSLQGSLAGRAGAFDPGLLDLQGMFGSASGAFQNAINNQNTATGLSPEALSALRTQGTSGINDQYQSAAQAMNSALLRRGAMGGGELPGSGGDISRAYQPLYSAMEAAKSKAQTDTILADEAAKRQSLLQNQQMALSAANNVFGNANTLFSSGNDALTGAASIANAEGKLETPDIWKLLETALLNQAIGGGGAGGAGAGSGGGAGGLFSGGGINGTGKYGVLGDLLGKLFGGSGDTKAPSIGPIQGPTLPQYPGGSSTAPIVDLPNINPGGIGTGLPDQGADPSLLGKVAGIGNSGLADAFGQLPQVGEAPPMGGGEAPSGDPADSALKTVAGYGSTAVGALTTAAKIAGTTAKGLLTTMAHSAVPLLTNPWTAAVGLGIITAVAWTKSQAHWEANTWVNGFQKPFDDQMAGVQQQADQLKASGQYTPEVAAQLQSASKQALDGYLQRLDSFYREKGTNSDQGRVASQAWATFQKYYGPGGQNFLNGLAA